jgi:CRISPR type III-A-associated protein Csm2
MPKEGEIIEVYAKNRARGKGLFVDLGNQQEGLVDEKNIIGDPARGEKLRVKVIGRARADGKIPVSMQGVSQQPEWWSLNDTFFDHDPETGNSILKTELLTNFANKLAEESAKRKLKINGLRNFYDAFKSFENRLNQAETLAKKQEVFRQQLPLIKMMKARVAHSLKKSPPSIPDVFAAFLNQSIDIISTREDFDGFMIIFEAVAGWHTYHGKGQ